MSTRRTETWHILHIDDDEDDHFIVRSMLSEAKGRTIRLDWAASFEEGRQKLLSNHYQAVLVDYDLGSGSGIDLIREFVARKYIPPFILLTGRGSYEVDLEAMHAGATLYLTKNEINSLLLERSIRYAIEHRQAEEDLQERDQKLSVALDAAQLGTWTYTFEDHVFEMDQRAQAMYHSDQPRISHDFIAENQLHPDDVQPMWMALAKAADPLHGGRYQMEYRILQPGDRAIEADVRWLNAWGIVEFEGDGEQRRPVRLIGASKDITWEKQAMQAMEAESTVPVSEHGTVSENSKTNHSQRQILPEKTEAPKSKRSRTEELELVNQRLCAVLRAFPVAVLIADAEGRIVESNQMDGLWGENASPIETIEDFRKFHGWWADTNEPLQVNDWPLARAIDRGETSTGMIVDIERFDGKRGTILIGGAPVMDSNGNFLGAVSVGLDISEQRRLEREAREVARDSRRKAMETESVFNALSDAVLVYDPNGRIQQANAQAIALFGFDPLHLFRDQIAQKLVMKTTEGAQVFSADLPSTRALEGEVLVNERFSFTNPRGRTYTVLVSALPTVLGNEITGVVEVWHDVTERERLLNQLSIEKAREKARAAELEALMDAVPAAIWVAHDPECKQVTGNNASYQLVDLPCGSDQSQNPLSGGTQGCFKVVKDGQDLTPDQLPMQTVMREKTAMNDWEAKLQLPNGTSRYILGNANPLFDDQGQLHGAISAFIDVTELKRAQAEVQDYAEKLERSNHDLEQFAFVASHDLQEPLRKVRFFGERLQEDLKETISDQEREYIDRMLNASQRMQAMISDLLTYSRITTKARSFMSVDLMEVVQEVISDLEIRIQSSNASVMLDDLPVIDADPLQMRQLLLNLITNGLKFHHPDREPHVQVDCQRLTAQENGTEKIQIAVKDNGIGFDLQFLERIFKPFERLHGRSKYEGSGMGLAICRKIVERHHGTISAVSEPGVGSTFIVQLPVRQAEPEKE